MTTYEMLNYIMNGVQNSVPYGDDGWHISFSGKRWYRHANKPHIKDMLFNNVVIGGTSNELSFTLGNEWLEANFPYYHILEDAKIIRLPYKGTKRSRGSQALVSDKWKRDYGKWSAKPIKSGGYKMQQEYRSSERNYQPYSRYKWRYTTPTADSNFYENKHFGWIERGLYNIAKDLARQINATLKISVASSVETEDLN